MKEDEPQAFSPPQYQKRAAAREAIHTLEDRLVHFMEWLIEQGFSIEHEAAKGDLNLKLLALQYVEG